MEVNGQTGTLPALPPEKKKSLRHAPNRRLGGP